MKALALFLLVSFTVVSAQDNNGRGVKATSLANAFVALADNSWAVAYNPAGLARITSPEISVFFVPQQFGIPELRTVSLSGAWKTSYGTPGASVEQFGFELYRTTDIRLGYGLSLDSIVNIGATVNVGQISIAGYGATHTYTVDVGLLGEPVHNVAIGFCARNVSAATIGKDRERLPQYLLLGICYRPFDGFSLVSEAEKDLEFPLVLKTGLEQRFFEFLSFRCGVSNNPDKFSAGIAVRCSVFEFGYAGYSHPELGWTHQIEISMR